MKDKIITVLKNIIIFEVYYLLPVLFNYILEITNINISNFSKVGIMIILYTFELVPALFMIIIHRKALKDDTKTFKDSFTKNIDKYFRLWLLALFLMSASNMIITFITGSTISNNEEAIRSMADVIPIYTIITSALIAPIAEELAYRKTIGNIFSNKWLSIFMSGLIFGLAHVISTYTNIIDLLYIIPYGLFGSIFMYIYLDSKSIYTTIIIHTFHNSLLLLLYFL